MADLGYSLRIKYGLIEDPAPNKIDDWVRKTDDYIKNGYKKEDAGENAARDVFPDYSRKVYRNQADTIEALLDEAKKK